MNRTTATPWRSKRVLVTGATGFLGQALCRQLLAKGATVWGTSRSQSAAPGVHILRATLPADADHVLIEAQPELVFHLAAPIDHASGDEVAARLRPGIVKATLAMASACTKARARLIHIGSCAEYGTAPVPYKEDGPTQPTGPYGALKLEATRAVIDATREQGLDALVLRPFRTYGPGGRRGLVPSAIHAALKGDPFPMTLGNQVREWNHVDAMVHGMLAAAASDKLQGRILNLGGGPQASVLEVVQRVFALADADPALIQAGALPLRTGEVPRLCGAHDEAHAVLGRFTGPSLDAGLADTLAWHRSLPNQPPSQDNADSHRSNRSSRG